MKYPFLIISFLFIHFSAGANPLEEVSSFLVSDESGNILLQKNPDIPLPIASLTKLVTILTARELFDIPEKIQIPKNPSHKGGKNLGLKEGEIYRSIDLQYAIMLESVNDAAYSFALGVGGREDKFVDKMNEWIKNINLTNTKLVDPTGISSKNISSAKDIYTIVKIFFESKSAVLFEKESGKIKSSTGKEHILVKKIIASDIPGIEKIEGKTGFIKASGNCFAGFFIYKNKKYYLVILNGKNFQKEISEIIKRIA